VTAQTDSGAILREQDTGAKSTDAASYGASGLSPRWLAALLTVSAFLLTLAVAFAPGARASAPGDPVEFSFNHAALFTQLSFVDDPVDGFILRPGDGRGEVTLRGTYTDRDGSFTVPASGLSIPDIQLRIGDLLSLDATLSQVGAASGSFDEATGELTFKPDLALGFSAEGLGPFFSIDPDEPFDCSISPLASSFSTEGGWPHPGQRLADESGFTTGALAGVWRSRPPVENGELCALLASLVEPVGGLWLANSAERLIELPAATSRKPSSIPYVEPSVPRARIARVSMPARTMAVSSGSVVRMPVRIRNSGDAPARLTAKLTSSRAWLKVARRVQIRVPAGKTVVRRIPVRITRRAKGGARITARIAGHKGTMRLRVRQ
jgi:hypothetical protein